MFLFVFLMLVFVILLELVNYNLNVLIKDQIKKIIDLQENNKSNKSHDMVRQATVYLKQV